MFDSEDDNLAVLVVDLVDNPKGASSGHPCPLQLAPERLAYPLRSKEQGTGDQIDHGDGDSFG